MGVRLSKAASTRSTWRASAKSGSSPIFGSGWASTLSTWRLASAVVGTEVLGRPPVVNTYCNQTQIALSVHTR